ncbi:hypothetical protein [Longimicrobium sp.]|uniref:hypothetical protein n=1 Tax=Longimicrobium sp. TaxID=2029185 RepID=UPI002CEAEF32|nr:hypothetical protein [Longimicrobium sp.]HSU13466.1 hypothetical protein [Longimicrobium sp.]
MEPLTNDERIAALLDGKLGEEERAALLAELGLSRDDLELLLDSAGITAELEEEDRAAGVIPITTPRPAEAEPRKFHRPPVWRRPAVLSAAAVAVLAIGGGLLLTRGSEEFSPVAALSHPERGVPVGLVAAGSLTRGDETALGPGATSVRFGVFAADLELSARAGDRTRISAFADSVAGVLEGPDGAPSEAETFRTLARRQDTASLALVQQRIARAEDLLQRDRVVLGRWIETARVAAKEQDAAFFSNRRMRKYLEGDAGDGLNGPAHDAIGRARGALRDKRTPDWPALQKALDDLLSEVG